jgi:hypothetical protein
MPVRRVARYLLAVVRIVNGALGLAAPQVLSERIEGKGAPTPATIYAFRLFGIRTILLGLDLIVRPEAEVQRALRQGVLIHGSDLATVVGLAKAGKLPPKTAKLIGGISAANLALAIVAMERKK